MHRNTTIMIYAFLNQKGGVGKTTLSIHTAAQLSAGGRRVLLIDADPQGSALAWSNCREQADFTVIGMPKATIHNEIESLALATILVKSKMPTSSRFIAILGNCPIFAIQTSTKILTPFYYGPLKSILEA